MARVLVVEPDAGIGATVKRLLEDAGHHVAATPDAFVAGATIVESPYPLVVLVDPRTVGSFGGENLLELASQGAIPGHAVMALVPGRFAQLPPEVRYLLASLSTPVIRFPVDVMALRRAVGAAARRLPHRVPRPPIPGSGTDLLPQRPGHHTGSHVL